MAPGAVELTFTEDPAWFLGQAADLLAADPVLTTVVGSYTRRLAATGEPPPSGRPRWWVLVHEGGELVAAAMRTMPGPPWAPYLLPMPDDAALTIARTLHGRGEHLTSANGFWRATRVLAEETARLRGERAWVRDHHRLHRLATLVAPRRSVGRLRAVRDEPDDLALAADWLGVFHAEADRQAGREPEDEGEAIGFETARRRAVAGELWFWEVDGRPVHLSGATPPADGVVRVGPVFTPREHRGRGYASAAVHAACSLLGRDGVEVCLFTDLANPTSNKIYADLGFEAYAETASFRIGP